MLVFEEDKDYVKSRFSEKNLRDSFPIIQFHPKVRNQRI